MSPSALTGLQAWLESAPPGAARRDQLRARRPAGCSRPATPWRSRSDSTASRSPAGSRASPRPAPGSDLDNGRTRPAAALPVRRLRCSRCRRRARSVNRFGAAGVVRIGTSLDALGLLVDHARGGRAWSRSGSTGAGLLLLRPRHRGLGRRDERRGRRRRASARPHDHAALPRRVQLRHRARRGCRRPDGAGRRADRPRTSPASRSLILAGSLATAPAVPARASRRPRTRRPARRRQRLAGAAHAADRGDGARAGAHRGHGQRLAGPRARRTGTASSAGWACSASPASSSR